MKNQETVTNFNQRNRDAWVEQIAARLPTGTRILDIGAGQCRYRPLFRHCQYQAQDFAAYEGTGSGSLRESWSYSQLDYVCDAAAIPVEDGSFDAILCTEVLEHVPEPILVLKEIGRILRLGGHAFITAPLGSGLHQQPYHFYGGFTPYFYRHFLARSGMEVISIEPNGHFFRFLLQELHRGVHLVRASGRYPRWHPAMWLPRGLFHFGIAQWLDRLDDQIPVDEFTVGYFVEAVKVGK